MLNGTDQLAVELLADFHVDRDRLINSLVNSGHSVCTGYGYHLTLKEARDIVEQGRNGGLTFLTTVTKLGNLKSHLDLSGLSGDVALNTVRCWPTDMDGAYSIASNNP